MFRHFLLILITFLSHSVYGNYDDSTVQSADAVKLNTFNFSLSVGFGQRSVFVLGQKELNIYVAPNISYYGEQVFFDNGTLGYTLKESPNWAASLITEFNPYSKYFNHSHISNSFVDFATTASSPNDSNDFASFFPVTDENELSEGDSLENEEDNTDDIVSPMTDEELHQYQQSYVNHAMRKREISLDAGVQINYFLSENQKLEMVLAQDVSDLHNGKRVNINWALRLKPDINVLQDWSWVVAANVEYLDANSANYYFGFSPVEQQEAIVPTFYPGTVVLPSIMFNANRKISDSLSFTLYAKYQYLPNSLKQSPITTTSSIETIFAGLTYAF